ncbi:interferon-inducible GTPase 5-like [Eublepharis macularius]|uniref:Interferon-inducible GTPase 5-like n=1 Tax=Eublepharis macularius TaxID=481883 RepID=A0AA97LGU3_EUBMA|nr:interferon-inducible GTPase 5-like [Eublepharis macularius]
MGSSPSKSVVMDELQEMEVALRGKDLPGTMEEINKDLNALKNTTVDIAITGVSGAGKSSLVNALRGMTDDEEGAAESGVMQTTTALKGYPHPLFPNVMLWDLPGIGTSQFKAKEYLKTFSFKEYDLFIIVSSERFTENDVLLAREIHKIKKKFYYVRTKVDVSIDSERRRPNFSEENTLEKIRKYCCDNLSETGYSNPKVFLISRWDWSIYDFPLLYSALENDLDDLKRHVLIESMPGFSREIIRKKKAAMDALIWKVALVSCGIRATPVPGFHLSCDIAFLEETMRYFCKVFAFDEFSLRRLAHWATIPFDELRSAVKRSPMASQITKEFVTDLLNKSMCAMTIEAEFILDLIPVLGSLCGVVSFTTVFYMLKSFLYDVEEDAENIWAKAAEYVQPKPCTVPRTPQENRLK